MLRPVRVDAALELIPREARIVATPGCAAPTTLLAGLDDLAQRKPDLGLHLYTGLQLEDQPFLPAVAAGALRLTTWHASGRTRPLIAEGRANYLPLRLSDVPATIERLGIEVALIRVSPPDADGMVSLGPSMSYSRAAVDTARVIIAEVDPLLPRTHGPTRLSVDRIAAIIASERPTPRYRSPPVTDTARRIGELLLDVLPDRATLQFGVGQVPEAVLDTLLRNRVGAFRLIGLATDRVVDLAEADMLAPGGAAPPIAAVELMGTERLMRFADDNPTIGVYPSTQGHRPAWLASHFDRIVAINSAVEVDLLGQVNAEMVDGVAIAGIGGSADFVDAARASPDGLSVIALPATARGGTVSRIVAHLPRGVATTIPRHAYDLAVTEHGIADLRGRTDPERARALVAIAAPPHRGGLEQGIAT